MWLILGLIVVTGIIMYIEASRLKQEKLFKERIVFYILITGAFTLSLTSILDFNIPNPLEGLKLIYRPLINL